MVNGLQASALESAAGEVITLSDLSENANLIGRRFGRRGVQPAPCRTGRSVRLMRTTRGWKRPNLQMSGSSQRCHVRGSEQPDLISKVTDMVSYRRFNRNGSIRNCSRIRCLQKSH
jgi:hypothetical protein